MSSSPGNNEHDNTKKKNQSSQPPQTHPPSTTTSPPENNGRGRGRGGRGRGRGRGGRGARKRNSKSPTPPPSDGNDNGESAAKRPDGQDHNRTPGRSSFSGGRGRGRSTHPSGRHGNRHAKNQRDRRAQQPPPARDDRSHSNRNRVAESYHVTDEEVLIKFAPYLRKESPTAIQLHSEYNNLSSGGSVGSIGNRSNKASRQREFVSAVRKFLEDREKEDSDPKQNPNEERARKETPSKVKETREKSDHAKKNKKDDAVTKVVLTDKKQHQDDQKTDERDADTLEGDLSQLSIQNDTPVPSTVKSQARQGKVSEAKTLEDASPVTTDIPDRASPSNQLKSMSSMLKEGPPPSSIPETDPPTTKQNKPVPTKAHHTPQPKRLIRNQPGELHIQINSSKQTSLSPLQLRPRQEFHVYWSLPLLFLRNRFLSRLPPSDTQSNITIRDALQSLHIGLFRLGCSSNESSSSIISKACLDFSFQVESQRDCVNGRISFYAPRSPGNFVTRLYFEDSPLGTLGTSKPITLVFHGRDVEQTLRFLLGNLKAKKGNGIHGMYSIASVVDNFAPSKNSSAGHSKEYEGAGRILWGCICECRKLMENLNAEYSKNKEKILKKEESLKKMKEKMDSETMEEVVAAEKANPEGETNASKITPEVVLASDDILPKPTPKNPPGNLLSLDKWKEKMQTVQSDKYNSERKNVDVNVAYAALLRAAIQNDSPFLSKNCIMKLRLEYELWCPLCDSFAANPFEDKVQQAKKREGGETVPRDSFPHPISNSNFRQCVSSREKMQSEKLGFVPKRETLEDLSVSQQQHKRSADSNSVDAFLGQLSRSVERLYLEELAPSKGFFKRRETIKKGVQDLIAGCEEVPKGTNVVVFGSSANGFGSSTSDLDMCLQLPAQSLKTIKQNGTTIMTKLAELLETAGMKSVDTSRLTARIPVVMFEYPYCPSDKEDDMLLIPCDISLQNPLAVMNTELLFLYGQIHPHVRVLASIVKRWAKQRNINDPSHRTLSSYGYILMILHFLMRFPTAANDKRKISSAKRERHFLPNIQWMDPNWVQNIVKDSSSRSLEQQQQRYPYANLKMKPNHPQFIMPHPTEPDATVNTYFYRPPDQTSMSKIQQYFSSSSENLEAISLGTLLTSFFHYYAYEFNYKEHVVSLNCDPGSLTPETLLVQSKEVKAETSGWKSPTNSSSGNILSIEDPFETFYDVAHVLRVSTFHYIQREFALAYTKIVEGFLEKKEGEVVLSRVCEKLTKS